MIEDILFFALDHVILLIGAGLFHEIGHRVSLIFNNISHSSNLFKVIIPNYEYVTTGQRLNMYMMGILFGFIIVLALASIAPLAPVLYLIGCHSDIKEIFKEGKNIGR